MTIELNCFHKDEESIYAEYHSKDKLTAKELLQVLLKLDKAIDLNKIIVEEYVEIGGTEPCDGLSLSTNELHFF